MSIMTGMQRKSNKNIQLDSFKSDKELADNFNTFYLKFDRNDFKEQVDQIRLKTSTTPQLELDTQVP